MRRDGCKAEQLGGAGDNACDVRAVDPAGRVWAIQCKHRRDGGRGAAVGVGVLQQGQRHCTPDPRSGHRGRPHQRPLLLQSDPLG
ncbi:restriction endonuclease [Streptomyces sp. NPDC017225]